MADRLCPYDLQHDSKGDAQDSKCDPIAALERSVKELRHAINNPLLLIIGHTQLLLNKDQTLSAETRAKLEKILQNAEKIRSIVVESGDLSSAHFVKQPSLFKT